MATQQTDASGAALVYCRVSTKGQEEGTSLESQEAACVAHAQTLGFTIGRITRETYSGAELWDRPRLSVDRADLKSGQFAALVCYSTDRLSRDPIHLAIIADECDRAGVALHFVSETFDDSDESALIRYVKGYSSKKEREKIRERSLRGKHTRALQGKVHGAGRELYGYRRDKERGVRLVHGEEAVIVRQIFEMVAIDHLSIREVARRLNAQNTPPPSAGKVAYDRQIAWCKNTIAVLLHHPAYKGESIAWRYKGSKKTRIIRPESEWIQLPEGVTPAIVSADMWQAAQDALATRKSAHATRNASRQYLMRGMVYCATCGKRMYGSTENGDTHAIRTYRCSSRDTPTGKCGGARIPADTVEAWAWSEVAAILRDPERIAAEVRRRQEEGPDATMVSDRETAARRLATIERKQAEYMQRYSDDSAGAFPWELVEREVKRLEAEKIQWRATLEEIDARIAAHELAQEQLQALHDYCARVSYNLDAFGFAEKRLAVEALDVRITGNAREWAISGSIPVGDASGITSHNISMLWPPLAATSSARLTCSWPRTSARSKG